ncbi:MAG TPA: hypothetical protein VE868_10310 [Balneolaceae bacterium]|nr:hypothetical protein [Balneolaceae bacterium]
MSKVVSRAACPTNNAHSSYVQPGQAVRATFDFECALDIKKPIPFPGLP